jgi:uracil-DNA glycosylase family 4
MEVTPYSEGRSDATIAFIAEAPARNEMVMRRPLVGEAGKLFNQYLAQAGIARSDCQIHNVSRIPIKDVEELMVKGKLTKKGQDACGDLLSRLRETTANVYMPLGALATCCLLGDARITKLRGSQKESTLLPGRKVIPTFHPASTLPWREYNNRYLIIRDLEKAVRHSMFPGLRYPKRELIIRPSIDDALGYVYECLKATRIAFDIETINHQVSCISFATSRASAICIPIHNYWTEAEELLVWKAIAQVLESPNIGKIGSGLTTFDIPFLMRQNQIFTRGTIFDTVVAHRIIHPDFRAGLEFLNSLYTDEPYYKDDLKSWVEGRIKDIEVFWRYNALDSATVFECWEEGIEPTFREDIDYGWMYRDTLRVFEPASYMGEHGVKIEHSQLKEVKREVLDQITAVENEIKAICGPGFNPGSPKQVGEWFYVKRGLKAYINRKTKKPTTDDKALARIFRKTNLPEAKLIQKFRSLSKLSSTYLEFTCDTDGRLRCVYNIRGTTTSRLSSMQTPIGTGMNNQNIHPSFRRFMIPDDPPEYLNDDHS